MDQLKIKAYAKINLGLDVIRKRKDGYHEVKMIMQTVGICDELTFIKTKDEGIFLSTDQEDIPTDQNNLIYRAAKILQPYIPSGQGVAIHLIKRIPVAAGMAGGSADAAAAFRGINELFALGFSTGVLREMAVHIGADIPYCIEGGTMLAEGIGEKLTRLNAAPSCRLVVAKPDISVSTKFVYENLNVPQLKHHPDIGKVSAAIEAGDLKGMADHIGNVLESVTEREYPVITKLKHELKKCGALAALMSGSGPTVFGIFDSEERAEKAYEIIRELKLAKQLFLTEFFDVSQEG